jgi:hypothetical protein
MTPLPLYVIPGKPETALVIIQHCVGQPTQLILSPNLRHSGLLRVMPLELLQVFIALLTFHDTMGEVKASVLMLSEALNLHPDQVEQRLHILSTYAFDGAGMVFETTLPSDEKGYSLSKRVGVPVDIAPREPALPTSQKPYRPVPREVIVERSRKKYGTPRAEAEALVAEQLGVMPPESLPEGSSGDLYKAMLAVGIIDQEARNLLLENPLEVIESQIEWLPVRGARNPARFLSAAIRGNYAPPQSKGYDATGAKNDTTGAKNDAIGAINTSQDDEIDPLIGYEGEYLIHGDDEPARGEDE